MKRKEIRDLIMQLRLDMNLQLLNLSPLKEIFLLFPTDSQSFFYLTKLNKKCGHEILAG